MLVNLKEILKIGQEKNIAIPAINTPNLETIIAAINTAEKLNCPIIIAHAQLHNSFMPIETIGDIMIGFAKKAKVPVCVHLDHGESFEFCKKAIDMGFTGVMIDASLKPLAENIEITKKVVDYAHKRGVGVEAELGSMPTGETGQENKNSMYTDPKTAKEFVEKTRVDALAISFGTAHGIYKVKPVLNIDIIKQIKKQIDTPLVMHGGSGLSEADYRNVIEAGITKINYYTYLAYEGYAAVKQLVEKESTGYFHDMTLVAIKAEENKLLDIMKIFTTKQ